MAVILDSLEPRVLMSRSHYRNYRYASIFVLSFLFLFWIIQLITSFDNFWALYSLEFVISFIISLAVLGVWWIWVEPRIEKSVQVFDDRIFIRNKKFERLIWFKDIVEIKPVVGSIFYIRFENLEKVYFDSSLERIDYVWEGVAQYCPQLLKPDEVEKFRLVLIQHDHHQKRKEWFFQHRFIDLINWITLPISFIFISFLLQNKSVEIHSYGQYFFRLFLYSLLVVLICNFLYGVALKNLIFDKKLKDQMTYNPGNKTRDLDYESIVLHRSKLLQFFSIIFFFSLLLRWDVNLYSITKLKDELKNQGIPTGKTVFIDNRYNCLNCTYKLVPGDWIIYGKGVVGQVLASQGDVMAYKPSGIQGRSIASTGENYKVPKNSIALKIGKEGRDVVIVNITDVLGKLKL